MRAIAQDLQVLKDPEERGMQVNKFLTNIKKSTGEMTELSDVGGHQKNPHVTAFVMCTNFCDGFRGGE